MTSSSSFLVVVAIIVTLLSISTDARPCKTFLISSYSLSITPENPNPDLSSSTRSVTIFTIRRLTPRHVVPFFVNRRLPFLAHPQPQTQIHEDRSFPFISDNVDSFRDRTRDILSVVVALLFGVGCGALTAATMYLVWALVVNRRYEEEEEEDYELGSDEASLKKLGYVKLPAPVKEAV